MKIEINSEILKKNSLTPNQVVFLYVMLHDKSQLSKVFDYEIAKETRNSLTETKYLMESNKEEKLKHTSISIENVKKLFGLKKDIIPFVEFYNKYPIKVKSRVLRSSGLETVQAKKHKKKYLKEVKTLEQHNKAVASIEAFVDKQRASGRLEYLPNMTTVMNNAMWQSWESLIETKGKEGQDWNDEVV